MLIKFKMGWGDVRYCFAMAILVIKSPKQSLGDLLFLFRFLLLLFFFIIIIIILLLSFRGP